MKNDNAIKNCNCELATEVIDVSGDSMTVRCVLCRRATLVARKTEFQLVIPLRDFHRTRGARPGQRAISDWTMATRLWHCLENHTSPTLALIVDFGICSRAHFNALRYAASHGISPYDLDRVMGDGPALSALVNGIPGQPECGIQFVTEYDDSASWREPKFEG